LEFELVDAVAITFDIDDDRLGGVFVVLAFGQVQQLAGADQAIGQFTDAVDGLVEQRTLAAQRLRAFGLVPDIGVFQLAVDFFQTLTLGVVVKDTPEANPAGR